MEGIIDLHHEIMFYVVATIVFVFWMLVRLVVLFNSQGAELPYSEVYDHQGLEWSFTLIPTLILTSTALPSFGLLFSMEDLSPPELTLHVRGHQWFWSYEYGSIDCGKLVLEPFCAVRDKARRMPW